MQQLINKTNINNMFIFIFIMYNSQHSSMTLDHHKMAIYEYMRNVMIELSS
jgi:hypothetical protein